MSEAIAPGTLIGGRFTVTRQLGAGGMGAVYLARQEALRRDVALKVLLPHLVQDELARVRFEREARVASRLRHHHAVEIYDFGEEHGSLYLAMELLEGESLRDLMERTDGPLPLERALHIVAQVADALSAAHRLALIHRDLKPENIFLEREDDGADRAVLVDFGLAFIADHDEMGRVTNQGTLYGSPAYMSPEQARDPVVKAPSDIYSLGCVLHELATGEVPFDGGGIQVLSKHCFTLPESPRERFAQHDIPPALDSLILRMLRKHANGRPTADDVQRTVRSLISDARFDAERVASNQLGRAARMVPRVPTEVVDRLPMRPQRSGVRLRIVGELSEEVARGLKVNGFDLDGPPEEAQIVVALGQPVEILEALVGERPVIADGEPGDMPRISALLRLKIAEVVPAPVELEELSRRLRRVSRRLKR